jgi:hypothetical protein
MVYAMTAPARKSPSDPPLRAREPELDVDVPAAVVCALCGDSDCPGCQSELSRSGVVTIVAWERPGGRVLPKLWETAHAATRDAEAFFELLPDGPLTPAIKFAMLCELIASGAIVVLVMAFAGALAPAWLKHVALDPAARDLALRIVATGVPALALLLVVAHAAHGFSLDVGARKNGARAAATRALRFGLYAAGWDLVQGPVGAVVVGWKKGLGAWAQMHVSSVPTKSSRAFLRGCYRLVGPGADRALGTSYVAAVIATLVGAMLIVAAAFAIVLAV